MKLKKLGKYTVLAAATAALVATLVNDQKRKKELEEQKESNE